jgi:hypothetical protein
MVTLTKNLPQRPSIARTAANFVRSSALRPLQFAVVAVFMILGVMVIAQVEGEDRGIAPVNSSSDFEVANISVDVSADTPDEARVKGWQEAQRKGWQALYKQLNGGAGGPALSDGQLDGIVSAIVVEQEQIGPKRYIATLGVLFDRARAGQILGVSGRMLRSPPLLVIPINWVGDSPQVFEARSPWQRAWAEYRTVDSSIDYVRVAGTGSDTLLLNAGQQTRRSRTWWRAILDQYGAADVLMPSARLERKWPGGPVIGHFAARYGPDNELIGTFQMEVKSSAAIPAMMKAAVLKMDELYTSALMAGRLRADSSLVVEEPVAQSEALKPAETPVTAIDPAADSSLPKPSEDPNPALALPPAPEEPAPKQAPKPASGYTIQFDTPNVGSVGSAENSVAGVPGVRSAQTSSLALGGTSVMRVSFEGDVAALRQGLMARGWRVSESGSTLRISRR